jgi:hypothetical protein
VTLSGRTYTGALLSRFLCHPLRFASITCGAGCISLPGADAVDAATIGTAEAQGHCKSAAGANLDTALMCQREAIDRAFYTRCIESWKLAYEHARNSNNTMAAHLWLEAWDQQKPEVQLCSLPWLFVGCSCLQSCTAFGRNAMRQHLCTNWPIYVPFCVRVHRTSKVDAQSVDFALSMMALQCCLQMPPKPDAVHSL